MPPCFDPRVSQQRDAPRPNRPEAKPRRTASAWLLVPPAQHSCCWWWRYAVRLLSYRCPKQVRTRSRSSEPSSGRAPVFEGNKLDRPGLSHVFTDPGASIVMPASRRTSGRGLCEEISAAGPMPGLPDRLRHLPTLRPGPRLLQPRMLRRSPCCEPPACPPPPSREPRADSITGIVSAIDEGAVASIRPAWGITLPLPGHTRAV